MSKPIADYMQNARPLRDLYGYSQTYVAFSLGVSQSLYCKVENGQVRPTLSLIEGVCGLYNISVIDFLGKAKKELLAQVVSSDSYRDYRVSN